MAMSDCEKCWDTPCECGWGYRDWSQERLEKFIANLFEYRSKDNAVDILANAGVKIIRTKNKTEE